MGSGEERFPEDNHLEVEAASQGDAEAEVEPILPEQDDLLEAMEANNVDHNAQVGLVLTRFEEVDPVWKKAKQAEATRLWARFFSSGNVSALHINILTHWANFLTVMLLSPNNFQWAKNLLSAMIPEILMADSGSIEFSVPVNCPKNDFKCPTEADEEGTSKEKELTQSSPRKRSPKRSPVAIVETQMRRSTRQKHSNKGFKGNTCSDRKCLACGPETPILNKEVIKSWHLSFAN